MSYYIIAIMELGQWYLQYVYYHYHHYWRHMYDSYYELGN
jgi:hypothetical protein